MNTCMHTCTSTHTHTIISDHHVIDTYFAGLSLSVWNVGIHDHIKITAPWATGHVVETAHPLRDDYKFREIVSFPVASNLYFKFDPCCSSQYDFDKLIVYAENSNLALMWLSMRATHMALVAG